MAKKRAVKKKALPKVLGVEFRAEPITATSEGSAMLPNVLTGLAAAAAIAAFVMLGVWLTPPATAATPNHFPIIAAEIGLATIGGTAPAPTPAPSGKCEECNGTGKVGDGTIMLPCGACGGDGYTSEQAAPLAVIDIEPEQPAPVVLPAAAPTEPSPKAKTYDPSCADGSCGVGGQSFRPFRRLFGR